MYNQFESDNKDLDNRLADFVDHLMNEDIKEGFETDDHDLAQLQKMAVLVKKTFDFTKPSKQLSSKTRSQLIGIWKNSASSTKKKALWQQIKDLVISNKNSRHYGLVMNLTAVLALLLVVYIVFSAPINLTLTGAAGGQASPTLIIIAMGVVLLAVFLGLLRMRR